MEVKATSFFASEKDSPVPLVRMCLCSSNSGDRRAEAAQDEEEPHSERRLTDAYVSLLFIEAFLIKILLSET